MITRRFLALFLLLCSRGLFAQSAAEYLKHADSLLDAGNSQDAIGLYDKAIALDGSVEMAYRGRGSAYLRLGNYEKGEKDYHSALGINPKCARCYANLGKVEAEARHDFDKAIEFVNTGIAIDPKDAQLYLLRAKIKRVQGRNSDALIDFNRAVDAEPENAVMHMERGVYNVAMGFYPVAVSDFSKVIELTGKAPAAYENRAHCLVELKRYDEALSDMDSAISQGGRTSNYFIERGGVYASMQRYPEGLADYDTAIALSADSYLAYYNRGLTRYQMEDLDGACSDLKKGLDIAMTVDAKSPYVERIRRDMDAFCDPAFAAYYYQRGIAAYNRNDFAAAVDFYNAGMKKFPNNVLFLYFRGNAWIRLKKYREALGDYSVVLKNKDMYLRKMKEARGNRNATKDETALMIGAAIPSIYEGLSESHIALGNYEEALRDIDEAITLKTGEGMPGSEIPYNNRGVLYLIAGRDQDAVEDFDRVILNSPTAAEPYVNRAIAYINLSGEVRLNILNLGIVSRDGPMMSGAFPLAPGNHVAHGEEFLRRAIASSSKAIELDGTSAPAYELRGYVKALLSEDGACDDLKKAKLLGARGADGMIGAYCK
ncbi:MAG: UDP-N-acetylglucosamine--peptide N-acetylglucosaminyltransferase kDa subunit-like [Chlorobi bacterium]|nr:UDP-N-acetylglucosamine--peptide N-acetylglucosaminyltransferase kDa subunit-like [Chlorobiota bacterium]